MLRAACERAPFSQDPLGFGCSISVRMCEASACGHVAGCVAWASVLRAVIVVVVEVPCVVCGYGLAAACAWLGLTGDEGLPVGA